MPLIQRNFSYQSEQVSLESPRLPLWTKQYYARASSILEQVQNWEITPDKMEDFTKEWLPEFFLQSYLQARPIHEELNTKFYKTWSVRDEWWKTIMDIGAMPSKISQEKRNANYVRWIGKKLLLPNEIYDKITVEDAEDLISDYIHRAQNMVREDHEILGLWWDFRSPHFERIHSEKSPRELLKLFYKYSHEIRSLDKSALPRRKAINIALYEIIRVLTYAKLLLNWKHSHSNHTLEDDRTFLIRKVAELWWRTLTNEEINESDNPLYNATKSHTLYWKKNPHWGYFFDSEKPFREWKHWSATLEWMNLYGKFRDSDENTKTVQLLHASFRDNKNDERWVAKAIRKNLISMEEILDKKWFIFVVSDKKEIPFLIKLVENELSTLRSGWAEPPAEWISNSHSGESYSCVKWVLRIPHKVKGLKDAAKKIRRNAGWNKWIKQFAQQLSNKPPYNLLVEIQIYTLENYIKAECDRSSWAHHDQYEKKQRLETLSKTHPVSIYGIDAFRDIYAEPIRKKVSKILNHIESIQEGNSPKQGKLF